jgi:hypothetical protein
MRNLSGFVGEVFAACLAKTSKGLLMKNPHQDGYPDLLLLDNIGADYFNSLIKQLNHKEPFSNFQTGGVEVKATCGSVPSPTDCQKKNIHRPALGDERLPLLKSYEWKAHHRETNNLIGILWDFDKNRNPSILAIFFSSNLKEEHWGKVVQPKTGGGRTTSVSIMPKTGVQLMYEGWVLVKKDQKLLQFLDKYNNKNLLQIAFEKSGK